SEGAKGLRPIAGSGSSLTASKIPTIHGSRGVDRVRNRPRSTAPRENTKFTTAPSSVANRAELKRRSTAFEHIQRGPIRSPQSPATIAAAVPMRNQCRVCRRPVKTEAAENNAAPADGNINQIIFSMRRIYSLSLPSRYVFFRPRDPEEFPKSQ